MIRSTTADESNLINIVILKRMESISSEFMIIELYPALINSPYDIWLFVDLFEHKVFEASFRDLESFLIEFFYRSERRFTSSIDEEVMIVYQQQITFFKVDNLVRIAGQCLCVGRKEKFCLRVCSEDKWTSESHTDHLFRLIAIENQ